MPELKFLAQIPDMPTQHTSIFTLKPPVADEFALQQCARLFGLQGDLTSGTIQQDRVKIAYNQGPHVVTLHRASGGLRYQDLSRWQVDDGKSMVQYDNNKAVEIARQYVEKAGLLPLKESQILQVTRLRVGAAEPATGYTEERVIDIGVVFQQTINGVPVEGPGGKAVVYLDHQGEVTGFDRIWREIDTVYAPVERYQSPDILRQQLEKYWHDWATIEVNETRFGYFQIGWQDMQHYLQPAYIAKVTLTSRDKRIQTKSAYVMPAPLEPVEQLTPPRKRIKDQSPRKS